MKSPLWLAPMLLAACVAAPRDPFRAGEQAMLADDLVQALLAYDSVPVVHPRYPEARAAAAGAERRMRRGHEILLDGLLLRAEWRDQEALAQFERAREVWPGLPGVDALIAATGQRMELFGAQAGKPAAPPSIELPGELVGSEEVALLPWPIAAPQVAQPAVAAPVPNESNAATTPPPPQEGAVAVPPAGMAEVASVAPTEDPVANGLIAVERQLGRGQLELAVADLLTLAKRYPDEVRVRVHLVRVLHQRALVRYGQGSLLSAIDDWTRVLELDPEHRLARNLLRAASAEASLASPAR